MSQEQLDRLIGDGFETHTQHEMYYYSLFAYEHNKYLFNTLALSAAFCSSNILLLVNRALQNVSFNVNTVQKRKYCNKMQLKIE